jgi:hypothetical protein
VKEEVMDQRASLHVVPIHASDLKIGDFVVVELVKTAPDNVASLVMVTHPATAG